MKSGTNVKRTSLIGMLLFVTLQVVGVAAFTAPFVNQQKATSEALARANDAPLILGLTVLALLALPGVLRINARHVAILGMLCAVNAALRLAELTIIPLPGGFSPMFFLIIIVGYAYGAQFGFLFGAFSLLASALATGGVGPWLPFQMFGAGWMGLTAGLLRHLRRMNHRLLQPIFRKRQSRTGNKDSHIQYLIPKGHTISKIDLIYLLPFGFVWGLLYGAILNLYFWPLIDSGVSLSWEVGMGFSDTLSRYIAFYATTSLWWDIIRSIGNIALLLWLGVPLLHALQRFGQRFQFEVEPRFEPQLNASD